MNEKLDKKPIFDSVLQLPLYYKIVAFWSFEAQAT